MYPELPVIAGVEMAVTESGTRYKNRPDLLWMRFAPGTQAAGVFTQSQAAAAPVQWCRHILPQHQARALLVNAGNANAATGETGMAAVHAMTDAAARLAECQAEEVYVASTGVIGQALPYAKLLTHLPVLQANASDGAWQHAAHAISTTDTFLKLATRQLRLGERIVTINGIAKGSGMIAPNMATLLGFIFTDAAVPGPLLQQMLAVAADRSFNAITVDGDTSTNDTLLAFATGKAGNAPLQVGSAEAEDFATALTELLRELAQAIVKDGEGAQKFIAIHVTGAVSEASARKIGLTIGNSPLVKTAIAGEDANWGRIVAAAGRSGEPINPASLSVSIGGVIICRDGQLAAEYEEAPVAAHLKGQEITIYLDVGTGTGASTVWTCDLTHEYIAINADYRS
jgi:glutamate N-acetyltransferase/amino-acid N-acetyltransferase